jgi:hypothetical protein
MLAEGFAVRDRVFPQATRRYYLAFCEYTLNAGLVTNPVILLAMASGIFDGCKVIARIIACVDA